MKIAIILVCGLLILSPLSGSSAESIVLSPSRPSFSYYEGIAVSAILTEGGSPLASADVVFEIRDPQNSLVLLQVVQTDANGNATLTFSLPTGSPLGTYLVYASGPASSGSTSFSVYDDIAPSVSDPSDIVANATDAPTIVWDVNDDYPDQYTVLVNGSEVQSGSWTSGQIVYSVLQTSGTYEVVLTITDKGGNSATSTVLVTILDDLPPSLTLHNDTEVEIGLSETIAWDISGHESYELYANETVVLSGTASHIEYVAYSETLGVLNLTLHARASNGRVAIDQFMVYFVDTRIEQFSIDAPTTVPSTVEYNFSIYAQDRYQDSFQVWLDSILFQSGSWNWSSLTVNFGFLSLGTHDVYVEVKDLNGNSANSSFQVSVVDVVPPSISESKQITVVWAEDSFDLVWDVFDDNPGTYELLLNGTLIESGSWTAGSFTYQAPQNRLGVFNYTLVIYDKSLNWNQSSILLHVIPPETDAPEVIGPTELEVYVDDLPILINWTVNEENPANYTLLINGSVTAEGTYISLISFEFTGERGLYLLELTVRDLWGYETSVDLTLVVRPPIDELIPTIEGPPDVVTSSTSYKIVWIATDSDPDTYSIFIDGTPFKSNIIWSSSEIGVEVGDRASGTYNFTLVVKDLEGHVSQDSVYVTLLLPETTEGSVPISILPVFMAFAVLVRRWKR
ncbi:MAG: hypothetical protein D6732_29635 [Methanobacteriota archaeon]|nr:MAG: hypothetical protein D6732_29635 [Euryarchaeota archaeon]